MGKKKKRAPKVWCYYCEREFDDEKILIQHQKAKHYKCNHCHKKLSTAGGMVIHVLQVHKETITKVPNAKPERESTELEIFGMEGIPPEILAAHEGEQDDENPGKMAKVELPSFVGGSSIGSSPLARPPQQLYPSVAPVYVSPASNMVRPPLWPPQPLSSQPWYPGSVIPRPVTTPSPMPMPPPQPLFPIQSASSTPTVPLPQHPPPQSLFPIPPPGPPVSAPVSQLFPLSLSSEASPNVSISPAGNTLQINPAIGPSFLSEVGGSIPPSMPEPPGCMQTPSASTVNPVSGFAVPTSAPSHMYAAAPNTAAPCIGPPPVISNRAPGQLVSNEVYLVWDDEAMSMEERRLSLPQYQVHDEAFQMNSVDAAIDKRILESRLAGRMAFGV